MDKFIELCKAHGGKITKNAKDNLKILGVNISTKQEIICAGIKDKEKFMEDYSK